MVHENKNNLPQIQAEKEDGIDFPVELPPHIRNAAAAATFSVETAKHDEQEVLDEEFEKAFEAIHQPVALTLSELRGEAPDDFEDTLYFCDVYASVYSALRVVHELHAGDYEYRQWQASFKELNSSNSPVADDKEWGLKRRKVKLHKEVPHETISEGNHEEGKAFYEQEIKPRRIAWAVAERALYDAYNKMGYTEITKTAFNSDGHLAVQERGVLQNFHTIKARRDPIHMVHVVGVPYSKSDFNTVIDELTFEDIALAA